MKLATIAHEGGYRVALVDAERGQAWPVDWLLPEDERGVADDMVELIRRWPDGPGGLQPLGTGLPLSSVELSAPIRRPRRNLFCVGKNYREHAKEFTRSGYDSTASRAADAIPDVPIVFTKAANTVTGPDAPILAIPGFDAQLDYEAELAVVIGIGGRGIRKADAWRHVWGVTIANDVTARDVQARHKQWFLGKSFDGACPMGPWIVTRDEIGEKGLVLTCRVNGETRQSASTAELIFDVPTLIEAISAGITLEPGDIILTGTPAGVGIGFQPPRFLAEGDRVEIEIEGVGTLANRVERAPAVVVAPIVRKHAPGRTTRTAQAPAVRTRRSLPAERIGTGRASALLLHGLGGTSGIWHPQTTALSGRFTFLCPDLAGSGRASDLAVADIDEHVADLVRLLDEAEVEAISVAGHSMGSLIALHLAAAHPERVERLFLLGPINDLPAAARDGLRTRATTARFEGMATIAEAILKVGTSRDTQSNNPAAAAYVRESLLRHDAGGYAANCDALARSRPVDPARIGCPVTLVTGDEDRTSPPANVRAMSSAFGESPVSIIDGCGHWHTIEHSKRISFELASFLETAEVAR